MLSRRHSSPLISSVQMDNLARASSSLPSIPSFQGSLSRSTLDHEILFHKRMSEPVMALDSPEKWSLPRALSFPEVPLYWVYRDAYPDKGNILDGTYLERLYHFKDKSEITIIKVPRQNITYVDSMNLQDFSDVQYVDIAENNCQFESFRIFPKLLELHMAFNRIMHVSIIRGQFRILKVLDLSFNNLNVNSICNLGQLPQLKVLNISNNGLHQFPDKFGPTSYLKLEVFILDDNPFSSIPNIFVVLSRLPRLKILSLSGTKLVEIPYIETRPTDGSVYQFLLKHNYIKSTDKMPAFKPQIAAPSKSIMAISCCFVSRALKPHMISSRDIIYVLDFCNQKNPFPCLEQLNLANNKIRLMPSIMAVKLWPSFKKIYLSGNPVIRLPLCKLMPIRTRLGSRFQPWPISCNIVDPETDPFMKTHLVKRFVGLDMDSCNVCRCHVPQPDFQLNEHAFPNLDLLNNSHLAQTELPLPTLRPCQMRKYLKFLSGLKHEDLQDGDFIPFALPSSGSACERIKGRGKKSPFKFTLCH